MSKVIGFATQFYTLWDVRKDGKYETINGQHYLVGYDYKYTFIKNISTDLEKAKSIYPTLEVDENLRGIHSREWMRTEKIDLPAEMFAFGKLKGELISTSDDVWQLERILTLHGNARRKVYARRRLVELGELVRYSWMDSETVAVPKFEEGGIGYYTDYELKDVKRSYIGVRRYNEIKRKEAAIKNGKHYHNDGEKVTLEIKEIGSFGFDSQYGFIQIKTYLSTDGKQYTYKGSSAPAISSENFEKITATVKHGEYDGVKQTLLQRIKIIK